MPKSFTGIAAFLLVPCLAGNALVPASCAVAMEQQVGENFFSEQAISAPLLISPLHSASPLAFQTRRLASKTAPSILALFIRETRRNPTFESTVKEVSRRLEILSNNTFKLLVDLNILIKEGKALRLNPYLLAIADNYRLGVFSGIVVISLRSLILGTLKHSEYRARGEDLPIHRWYLRELSRLTSMSLVLHEDKWYALHPLIREALHAA